MNIFTWTIHAEHTRNEFYRTLSIQGTNFIACWAYWEPISWHAEHARKCLKVEYLGRIEYDFQKSRVTDPWDHKVSVSAKKLFKRISCLCTFNDFIFKNYVNVPSKSNKQRKFEEKNNFLLTSWRSWMKIAGSVSGSGSESGFISQRYGSVPKFHGSATLSARIVVRLAQRWHDSCSLGVLYGDLGIRKLQFLSKKYFLISCKFLPIFGLLKHGSGTRSVSLWITEQFS